MVLARSDACDGVLGGADAAWDIALAGPVISPADDRSVQADCDGVRSTSRTVQDHWAGRRDVDRKLLLTVRVIATHGAPTDIEHLHDNRYCRRDERQDRDQIPEMT